MKEIKLTQGKMALVDDADYEWLNAFKWHAYYAKNTKSHYARGYVNGKNLAMSRLIMRVTDRKTFVDHINHDTLNHQRSNLRLCTNAQNSANKHKKAAGSSQYKCVDWQKTANKWRVRIMFEGKRIHLGFFDSEIEAALAYDKKAIELFGEYAYLNFPKVLA